MKEDRGKYFFFGAVTGIALLVAPWWLALAIVVVIALKVWSTKDDGPTQA